MRILITNDDGIEALGIRILVNALKQEHEVMVVAPAKQQSGVGMSITLFDPLFVQNYEFEGVPAYSVKGTPVDCVKLGITTLFCGKVDVVVAGINCGYNIAGDVLYSGTVSAATEAVFCGIPSLAVSLGVKGAGDIKTHAYYEVAAEFAKEAVKHIGKAGAILNLNVPNLPLDQIKGLKVGKMGKLFYKEDYEKRTSPRGDEYYWIAFSGVVLEDNDRDTDVAIVHDGYACLTPLQCDRTNLGMMSDLKMLIEKG